ncbi:hypothetical protein [Chryseobacterium indologenes]|uniref:hypothetical protein n=1 Tax=Chryseobacterium indologenes TaxID=253 RepID=UPI0021A62520|nr:hypothetical protein [Elizabethkingia anophelis]
MNQNDLKSLIKACGKKGVVEYKGKDKRREFDESVNQKKLLQISNFIGNQTEWVAQLLR